MSERVSRQLTLDLGAAPALGREDFIAAAPNRDALAFVETWPDWPERAALLVGPAGSGKSHLAAVWRAASGAQEVGAGELDEGEVPRLLGGGALVIEDLPGSHVDERALFHALNLVREQGAALLLTSRLRPVEWPIGLPDLKSRLKALPLVEIGAPDDALLRSVLGKLLADRQLAVDPGVLDYLLLRMERSLDAARAVIETLDRLSLENRRPITKVLAAEALAFRESAPDE